METVTDFIFLGSKINADGDHSHKIKRSLLLGRKTMTKDMTNLHNIWKSRNTTLPTKVHTKPWFFQQVMNRSEQYRSLSAEELMISKLVMESLRVPRKSKEIKPVNPKVNQPWILTGRTDAEAPIPWQRGDTLEKTLMLEEAGGEGDNRG